MTALSRQGTDDHATHVIAKILMCPGIGRINRSKRCVEEIIDVILTGADPRTCLPLLPNAQLSQGFDVALTDFFAYPFAGQEPVGTYTVFAVLTPPGAFNDGYVDPGNLLVIDARPFSFSP
jgi:hypothetical protein